ncbi:formyltransferase family protein [Pseudomonas putida]|uniref:UDP-glucuronic acid dehydrogenase n=1 Tax=Pseudomonas putida TaxID=303 RepID=A0A1X1A2T9_PSEPU|nr:formyltransferase family protein [Pseudomonas putida]ORL66213.1 UDP-glucuronic acid dehydrogenase [Pseudomonas putida]
MRSLDITVLCTSAEHPVNVMLRRWIETNSAVHSIKLCRSKTELGEGDVLFLISCSEIIGEDVRRRFSKVLVLHASDLPKGRGWSPHIWEVIAGAETIVLSLLEAKDKVDSGDIWKKLDVPIPRDALFHEINEAIFLAEEKLLDYAVKNFDIIVPTPQSDDDVATYYSRRVPENSRIDPERTIAEQFDLLRVCDAERFPAFFEFRGARYKIMLEKIK